MCFAPMAQLLALAITVPGVEADMPVLQTAGPKLVFTRQTLFSIPFRIDGAVDKSRRPVEVRLYVSGDRGATWQLYSTVPPDAKHFLFRAGGDGRYCFLVRTLDRSGRLRPEGTGKSELQVVVDTTPPRLKLHADRGQAGQITARWEVAELHPKPNSLNIQYRTVSDGPWETVAVSRQVSSASGASNTGPPRTGPQKTGKVTWWPQPGDSRAEIRAEITDIAGNPAVTHAVLKAESRKPKAEHRKRK